MRARIRLVRHLPGALRACCQCHVIILLSLAGRLDQEMIDVSNFGLVETTRMVLLAIRCRENLQNLTCSDVPWTSEF